MNADFEPQPIDWTLIASLCAAMGEARVGQLFLILRGRLEALSAEAHASVYDGCVAATLTSVAHQSQGSASSLGLIDLAAALRDLEAAVKAAPSSVSELPTVISAALGAFETARFDAFAALGTRYSALARDHAAGEAGALNR